MAELVGAKRDTSQREGVADGHPPSKRQAAIDGADDALPASTGRPPPPHVDPLPAPWQEHMSKRTGKPYWYNTETKETTWTHPCRAHAPASHAPPQRHAGILPPGTVPGIAPSTVPPGCEPPSGAQSAYPMAVSVHAPQQYSSRPSEVGAGTGGAAQLGPTGLPLRPGAVKCSHFLRTGQCKFGDGCRFDHPPNEARSDPTGGGKFRPEELKSREDATAVGLPIRPGVQDCAYFIRTGTCKFGNTCKWNHPAERQLDGGHMALSLASGTAASSFGTAGVAGGSTASGAGVAAGGWETHYTEQGQPYYWNALTQESTWEPPPMMMKQLHAQHTQAMAGPGQGAPPFLAGAEGLTNNNTGAEICRYYMQTGQCKYGAACKYHHPPRDQGRAVSSLVYCNSGFSQVLQ